MLNLRPLGGSVTTLIELQDAYQEGGRRVRRHPQPEVLDVLELLEDLLERLEPRGQQAVLQQPLPALRAGHQHALRDRPLPLAERMYLRRLPPMPSLLASLKMSIRVGAGREHVAGTSGDHEDVVEVEHRRHHVLLPHLDDDELGDRDVDAVDAEAARHEHPLERVERLVVAARHRRRLGRVGSYHAYHSLSLALMSLIRSLSARSSVPA